MQDFFGNELLIGDKVAFMAPGYRNMIMGKIIKFTPQKMLIEFTNHYNYETTFLAVSNQVIKKVS